MFKTVLIANRGEIAVRIARTLRRMGIRSVAVYSDADHDSLHVAIADLAVALGGTTPTGSYLRGERLLATAKQTGAEAIIPGYGCLSENAEFAAQCAAAGIAFVGPRPEQIRRLALKHVAREIAEAAGLPLPSGSGLLWSLEEARTVALNIGYPLMLKCTAGGGGIGLSRCDTEAELDVAYASLQLLGMDLFNDSGVFIERFVADARHIEVQIFGDGQGRVIALGERDCSLQQRYRSVIEETPAPQLPPATRTALLAAAVTLGQTVGYASAGTVQFIYDAAGDAFYFLGVNTGLQVGHALTEVVTGLDLVEWMVRLAAGEPTSFDKLPTPRGVAIEARLDAQNPAGDFQPSSGVLTDVHFPDDVRVDTWMQTGTEVSTHYDPLLAKVIAQAPDREQARRKMLVALAHTRLHGITTTLDYVRSIVSSPEFAAADLSTRYLDGYQYVSPVIEVIEAGPYTTVQDYPGRTGYRDVGVPPSGPMDDYAFRVANRIVGNHPSAAGLECTLQGPTLRFHDAAMIALTGAPARASLDGGEPLPWWQPIPVAANQVLRVGRVTSGCRSYIAIRCGLEVPEYLGSRSTFVLGQFGGHAGRTLCVGDVLPVSRPHVAACTTPAPPHAAAAAPAVLVPAYGKHWDIAVLYGPHGAPDFFTEASTATIFASDYHVEDNADRLGVRLIGPAPQWARGDEAGSQRLNLQDYAHAIGSISFTGDTPVILTCDAPSLGSGVCPLTIAKAELWKLGQLKPGDTLRFKRICFEQALALQKAQDHAIETLAPSPAARESGTGRKEEPGCVLAALSARPGTPEVTYRQAGDQHILVEYGPDALDLRLRVRVHLLMEALRAQSGSGIQELCPGVRSLQVHYDSRVVSQARLIFQLLALERQLSPVENVTVPSRIIYLPLASREVELNSVFDTSYLVLTLGEGYLGGPCAVPLDPGDRLVTSTSSTTRADAAEGAVIIRGDYLSICAIDSPGGHQLVGRTVPIWNRFLQNSQFGAEPWLLRCFDQISFYPVSDAELEQFRRDFHAGRARVRIERASWGV